MDHAPVKLIASNRKAYHDYFVEDKYEAGIELCGTEVKSIRMGHVNLKDAFCIVKDGEMVVHGMHVSPYAFRRAEYFAKVVDFYHNGIK